MKKVKFRTKYQYTGRRKNANLSRRTAKRDLTTAGERQEEIGQRSSTRSATAKKLEAFGLSAEQLSKPLMPSRDQKDSADCYFFMQLSCLKDIMRKLACPTCHSVGLVYKLLADSYQGFSSRGQVSCPSCSETIDEQFTCKRVGGSEASRSPFDINMRATIAFRGAGCGFAAMSEWSGTMNLPNHLSQNAYTSNHLKLQTASKETFKVIVAESRQAIKDAYKDIGVVPDNEGILNVSVSYDGSWQRRGHSSHNGMAAVIDLMTGLPIDFEVLSNFCLKCKIASEKPSSEDLEQWKAKHASNCPKNFEGSSNAMEVECAVRLWKRSVEEHKFRYITMLSDGDSKAYDALVESNIYGDSIKLSKEDCVNHVSKRMGTAIRNLISSAKAQGQSITGRGKLTASKAAKIQNYYGRAIKDYAADQELLKKRIFAILFHMSSTDENPKHHHCPPGTHSWCFWQRAVAKSEDPGGHNEHETLPLDIGRKLVPVFQRLTDDGLLKRCCRGKTQNPNESLHNIIWKLCPKTMFAGRNTVETAVALAICQFSMGATFKSVLCKVLSMEAGSYMEEKARRASLKRISKAEKAHSAESKKRRKQLKFNTTTHEQKTKDREGVTYSAGTFS